MSEPKITIVTVSYNAVDTIETTILSVLNQTYDNIEYVIIDGVSTDGTINVIKKYIDGIAFFVSEPDNGIYDAMNKALSLATGDFVYFIGGDDVFYNNHVIEDVVNQIDDNNCIYYGNVIFGNTNHIHWGKFNKWKWGITNISHQAIIYPKWIYKKYKYDLKYKIYADHAYNLCLVSNSIYFKYIDVIFAQYNLGGVSARLKDEEFEKEKHNLIINAVGYSPMIVGIIYRFFLRIKEKLSEFFYKE